jgi:hypothetical protein
MRKLAFCALLLLAACSVDVSEAQLRPPPHWSALVSATEAAAARAAGVTVEASHQSRLYFEQTAPHLAGPALAQAIRVSRREALTANPSPIPRDVDETLARYYDEALRREVRWTRAGHRLSLGTLIAGWLYTEGAVTLQDVVVFSTDDVAHENVWLWAHELAHVEQYKRLGIDRFAAAYAANWQALEAEANARADAVASDIRARQAERRAAKKDPTNRAPEPQPGDTGPPLQ